MATPNPNLVPTLGILELSSIAKGLQVADLMLKKAEVRLLKAGPVGSGKFMIHLTGDEADLLEAVEEGHLHSDPFLVSWTYIPNLHPQVLAALQKEQYEMKQRAAQAKAAADKAERAKGVHTSAECLNNPLAKGCN